MKPKNKLKTFADNMSANHSMVLDVLIGAGCALLLTLLYMALYAVAIKLFRMNDNAMPLTVVNEVAKVLCILFGAWISVRKHPAKGWMRGGLTGLIYIVCAFILLSAIDGDWTISWATLSDLLMGAAVGAIGGILFVNLRKKK